ncbi:MAG: RNA-binding cell elongation regulator Jag/EloR [Dehalococcoidia bacterium]
MESLEVSGKTVDEAIEIALKELGVERDEIDVVVVAEGRSGILGIGSEPARIRVTSKEKTPEPLALAKETLEELLECMGVSASVRFRERGAQGEATDPPLSLDVHGEDSGLVIGRGGATLTALQFMVNFIVSRRLKSWTPVSLDVEGYRERRHKALRSLALRLAERVRNSGRPFTLEPMPASERRVIHLALAQNKHVVTESTGYGDDRKVSIRPKPRW